MSQKQAILKYLKSHKRITAWTAMHNLGCLRLSERIREIEASGVQIKREWLSKDGSRVMSYALA